MIRSKFFATISKSKSVYNGVDTPEKKQAFGQRAKSFTAQLTAGKVVDVETTDTDKYGRTVAVVIVDGVNVNRALVESGYA